MAKDIIELVREQERCAFDGLRRAVIISPGAVGDCVLLLPLAEFVKKSLGPGTIDFIGHSEYIDFYPGRTCIDSIRSIDLVDFHRLFADSKDFTLEDKDPLIDVFSQYELIISFMGQGHGAFESNLIFTVNCSHAAEIMILPLGPEDDFSGHLCEFYIDQFKAANALPLQASEFGETEVLIRPERSDIAFGKNLLQSIGIDPTGKTVLIHPGSGGKEKCWHLDNFRAVAGLLVERNVQVVFVLGPAESERFDAEAVKNIKASAKCISGVDLTSILQLTCCVDLYLGNDSGVTHLAAGGGTKTLAVFGPTNPVLYKPLGPSVRLFQAGDDSFAGPSAASWKEVGRIICEMLDD